MKQEQIDGNKLIAEFMGYRVFNKRYPRNHGIGAPEMVLKDCIVEKTKYHSSWDWLIPALNKAYAIIDDIQTKNRENGNYRVAPTVLFNTLNTFLSSDYKDGKKTEMYNIERAWKHLVEFIKDYERYNYEQEVLKKVMSKND